jgi:hypothetical protein
VRFGHGRGLRDGAASGYFLEPTSPHFVIIFAISIQAPPGHVVGRVGSAIQIVVAVWRRRGVEAHVIKIHFQVGIRETRINFVEIHQPDTQRLTHALVRRACGEAHRTRAEFAFVDRAE